MRPWEAVGGRSVRPNSDSQTDLTDLTDQIDQMCHKSLTSCCCCCFLYVANVDLVTPPTELNPLEIPDK